MLVSYNWIKEYLGAGVPDPKEIERLLTFHAFEVEAVTTCDEDTIFDVKILPDRGSDCLSQRGIAREIATLTGIPLVNDPLTTVVELPPTTMITVAISDLQACPRFTASLVTGITVGPSPEWLAKSLASLGQRSINNIVDATNYVMYATGQPLHAYDATKFPKRNGVWQFGVRSATAGETVSLLAEGGKDEDRVVTLSGGELLITDAGTDQPISLAGVKGGRFAGVEATTTDIIIEAAHFDPGLTRKTARGLGIVIDASKRFENEPSRDLPPLAQQLIVDLICKIAGGTALGLLDVYPLTKTPPSVVVRTAKVQALLGLPLLGDSEIMAILKRVGVIVEIKAVGEFVCTGPFERTDLSIEEDFIEEIGRVYGYHHVASLAPKVVPLPEYNQQHYYSEAIRDVLLAAGFSEVITSSFRPVDQVALSSSLASDKSFLRSSLTPALEEVLTKNAPLTDLLGTVDTRVFEIGTVFTKNNLGKIEEHVALALGVRLKTTGYSGKEDVVIAEALAALSVVLGAHTSWQEHKGIAECNLSVVLALLPKNTTYAPLTIAPEISYQPFSLYPSVSRDIAMWVGEGTDSNVVETLLRAHAGELLVRLTHLDTFTKEGRTSVAFRLVFQSHEKTLDGSEVDTLMGAVYDAVAKAGWSVR